MSSLLTKISPPEHPPRVDLLLYADGELAPPETARLEQHLKSCWRCRSHVARIEETIGDIIAFDEKILTPHLTPPGGWRSLKAPLRQLAATSPKPSWAVRLRGWFASWQAVLLTPRMAGVAFGALALTLAATLIFVQSKWPATVSAAELLERAQQAQTQELQSRPQPVAYQKLRVRRNGQPLAQWEIWRDTTTRRTRQTTTPEGLPADETGRALLELASTLQSNHFNAQEPLSAAIFQSRRAFLQEKSETLSETQLADGAPAFKLHIAAPAYVSQITEAGLLVRKSDWRVVSLRLTANTDKGIQHYEIDELEATVKSVPELGADFFAARKTAARPGVAAPLEPGAKPAATPNETTQPAPETQPLTAQQATSELEVELISRLDQVNAFLGEQLEVTRARNGALSVQGVVTNDARKREILQALSQFKGNPSVRIDVQTVAEAQSRQKRGGPKSVEDVSAPDNDIPLAGDARDSLAQRGVTGDNATRELNALSAKLIRRSAQLRSHALALQQIASRFSAAELARLDPAARARWRNLVNGHARRVQSEAAALRQEIGQLVPPQGGSDDGPAVTRDEDIPAAARRLYQLAANADAAVRRSFSVAAKGGASAPVKSAEFWRSLNGAENLAGKISGP